jgi:hypothetical protein
VPAAPSSGAIVAEVDRVSGLQQTLAPLAPPYVDPPVGTLAQRPAASPGLLGGRYVATDVDGGQDYVCNGSSWLPAGAPVNPVVPAEPGDLPGLAVHYTAGSLALPDNAAVSRWADQVGGNDLVQVDTGAQPTYVRAGINGQPTVRFASDFMDSTMPWVDPALPFHVSVLARFDESGAHSRDWVHQLGAVTRWLGYSLPDDAVQSTLGSALAAAQPHATNEAHLWALAYDGSTLRIKRDGTGVASASRKIAASNGRMRVGANSGGVSGGTSRLHVCEIVAYPRILTTREEKSLGRYMLNLYGVGA